MSLTIFIPAVIFTEIKDELREETEEKGAFYCDYQGFRDVYRVLRRGMERNGQSVFLVLCTLTDTKGNPMESSDWTFKMYRFISYECNMLRELERDN